MYAIRSYYGLFHVNDCRKGLGSRVDRHEQLGQGGIGRAGFAALMRDERFTHVPKILETPKGENDEFVITSYSIHYTKLYEWRAP